MFNQNSVPRGTNTQSPEEAAVQKKFERKTLKELLNKQLRKMT